MGAEVGTVTAPLPTFPDALRPHVAQILRNHYESTPGRVSLGAGISVTGAAMERAAMLSMRMRQCPTCLGDKVQRIELTDKRVITIPCWRCHGDGEIGEMRKTKMQEQTKRCYHCKGAGTVPRPEYRREKLYDPNPEKCDRCNGRSYHHVSTVLCGSGEYERGSYAGDDQVTVASEALQWMRNHGQERSRFVLEIAYGEVGRRVERHHKLPPAVAVWPHTAHGKRLLRHLGHYRGEPPFEALHDALTGDWTTATLAGLANTSAIAMLELALSHFRAADNETGGRVLGTAQRIEKEVGAWHR